ncbi:MAG: TonB-dependent receptor [Acidobacteriota bacterium]|nr:TonB-dependent receptor [Acidobacteriota bacterium]
MSKLFLMAIICAGALVAQDITGSIAGTVRDASGAGVPGAKVTVTATEQNQVVRTATSDASGNYSAPLLAVGKYSVSVEAPGFKKSTQTDINLNVNDQLTVNVKLEVGDVQQEVTVQAAPIAVELQSAAQSTVINGTQIRELALVTRNYEQLVALMPGVSSAAVDQLYVGVSAPAGTAATIPYAINGARTAASSWTVDGADNVDRGSNLTLLNTPSVDSIAEFKVQRSGYSAEFGRAGGGMVSVVTKSGTSEFHGDIFEFARNNAFAANNFLNNANKLNLGSDGKARVPALHYNDFGGTLGGPVWIPGIYGKNRNKNQTFFFFSTEFRRVITYSSPTATVPTAAEITGNFPHPICASYTGSVCNQVTQQITKFDPVAAQYVKDIFSKVALPTGTNTLPSLFRNVYNFEQELVKIDHSFSQNHRVYLRYLRDDIPTIEPGGLFTGAAIPGVGTTATDAPAHNWAVHETSTFSPTLLNEVGFNYSYGAIISDPVGLLAATVSSDIKVPLPFPVTLNQVPNLSFTGGSSLATFGQYRDYNRNYNVFDNLTKIMGRHTLKFGFSYNHYQKTENAGGGNAGAFAFTAATSSLPAGGATLFEQAFANFLVGNAAGFSQTSIDVTPDMRAQQWEIYGQDDWRVRPNLTLNLGVRYSMFRQPFDANNQLTTFDPALYNPAQAAKLTAGGLLANTDGLSYLNGISINGKNSPYGSKVARENKGNAAPRVGLAWDPFSTGKTSIRAGYGVSYDATLFGIYEQNIFANPPFVNAVSIPNTLLSNPGGGTASVQNSPKALRGSAADWKTPYTQQWSFDIERQFTPSTLLTVAYVGTKGTHLLGIADINTVPANLAYTSGLLSPTTVVTSANTTLLNLLRPYQGYNSINVIEPWFNSNYNSLQISGQKRFHDDSIVAFSYTWSKNLTDNQTDRSSAAQNFYNRKGGEYGLATLDRRHIFTANFVYNLPFFRAQKGFVGKALGGWEISGVTYFNTGAPNTVTTLAGTDPAALGILGPSAASPRPDMVCDPNAGAPHTRFQWFNGKCFQNVDVASGVHLPGNAGRGVVRGPGFERVDLGLFKNLTFKERYRFQIRGEATNAFNHANPNGFGSLGLGSGLFNTITSYRDPRIIQLGGKFYF